jgi:hypothetical protein
MKHSLVFLILTGLALAIGPLAFADAIPGLFNTGVDGLGNPLVGGNGVSDPHYTIISGPGNNIYPTPAVTFNCCYFADQPAGLNGNSRWVSVNANGANAGSGVYDFQTTFSLNGLDPSTAAIVGRFGVDNQVEETNLNGFTIAGATADTFFSYTGFTIPVGSPFKAGLNTLDFLVNDSGAPMSLRVDSLVGTASPAVTIGNGVPEPAMIPLLASGLVLLAIGRRLYK